jgi:hypothetical protein
MDEALRANGRGAQNWRLHGWWKSPHALKRVKLKTKDYGYYNHAKAAEICEHIDEKVWRSYFKFAFERNPWDRQVSLYYHRYRHEKEPPPFTTFIHTDKRAQMNNYDIYAIDGNISVDFIGRFENLEEDLKRALEHVGLTLATELPRAKTTSRHGNNPYRKYYDEDTRDIVGRWYAREIELLGYEF